MSRKEPERFISQNNINGFRKSKNNINFIKCFPILLLIYLIAMPTLWIINKELSEPITSSIIQNKIEILKLIVFVVPVLITLSFMVLQHFLYNSEHKLELKVRGIRISIVLGYMLSISGLIFSTVSSLFSFWVLLMGNGEAWMWQIIGFSIFGIGNILFGFLLLLPLIGIKVQNLWDEVF